MLLREDVPNSFTSFANANEDLSCIKTSKQASESCSFVPKT
jgi:hypothetical protein